MDQLKTLFEKYMNDSCTAAEIRLLMQNFAGAANEAELKDAIAAAMEKESGAESDEEALDMRMLRIYDQLKPKVLGDIQPEVIIRPIRSYFKYSVAAVFFIVTSVFIWLYINQNHTKDQLASGQIANDINPGGNKAILTLADGTKVSLTDAGAGELARQSGITITKTADGQLVYQTNSADDRSSKTLVYNTMSTPAGGQYVITLPDGTKVWLNAESSLKYPTIFNGASRKVILTGEGYFEVAKDSARPFVVAVNTNGKNQEVTVLGTHFNINAYEDEAVIKTTLLEGSVKVSSHAESRILKPGQQATLGSTFQVTEVDAMQAVDWKNGNFYFNDENIQNIMRKLARWYDVEVVYIGAMPDYGFNAEISRTKKLSEILNGFQITGKIHFKIEGRRVTVMQ